MIFREHLSIIDKLLTQYHRHSYSVQISAEELANYMLISKLFVASLHCKQSLHGAETLLQLAIMVNIVS